MKALLTVLVVILAFTTWEFKKSGDKLLEEVKALRAVPPRDPAKELEAIQKHEALKAEFESLRQEYDSFKEARRTSMLGKVYPQLVLLGGKTLSRAEVKEINAAMVTLAHDTGVSKVRLAELDDNFRWEAVWTAREATPEEQKIEEENRLAAEKFHRHGEAIKLRLKEGETLSREANDAESINRQNRYIDGQISAINLRIRRLEEDYRRTRYPYPYPEKINASGPVLRRIQLDIEKLETEKQVLEQRRR